MSDSNEKFNENAPGKYYVLKVCIGCTLCSEIAPNNFNENTDEELPVGHNYVYKQPEDDAEEASCDEAMATCPANAIRNDGNE